MKANIEKTAGYVREAARPRCSSRAALRSCSRASTFAREQDPIWFETAFPAAEHPCVLALKKLAQRTQESSSPSRSSRRMGRAITTRRHRRFGRRNPRRLPQEPHSGRARLPGEVLLPPRRHRLQDLEDESRPHRRRHLLGPMVPRVCARHGAAGRRGLVLPDRYRFRAL